MERKTFFIAHAVIEDEVENITFPRIFHSAIPEKRIKNGKSKISTDRYPCYPRTYIMPFQKTDQNIHSPKSIYAIANASDERFRLVLSFYKELN